MNWRVIAGEIGATVRAQRVFTLIMVLVFAGSTLAVVLTSGRHAASEAAVLSTIDAEGTRSVMVQFNAPHPDFTNEIVDALASYDVVEHVIGMGQTNDATSAANPGGVKVGVREIYGEIFDGTHSNEAFVSQTAMDAFGFVDGSGVIRFLNGAEYVVNRTHETPGFLAGYEPLAAIEMRSDGEPVRLTSMIVVARTPESVELVADLTRDLMVGIPEDVYAVSTSEAMAQLRSAIAGEMTRQGRLIVLGVLVATSAVALVNVLGLVMLRRKDYGRRRALGATQSMVMAIIMGQVLLISSFASLIGVLVGSVWLLFEGSPLPRLDYLIAVVIAFTGLSTIMSAVPGSIAAKRDPIRELRVP